MDWRPGRVTVFSVCAYWCVTWKMQVPHLVAARTALAGLPVDVFTISTDGRWAEVAANNGGLPMRCDLGGAWSHRVGIDRVPTTVVVDSSGKVCFAKSGVVRQSEIVPAVRQALAGAGPAREDAYLTFDEFPPLSGGDRLLDFLRAYGVPVTLFCVGDFFVSPSQPQLGFLPLPRKTTPVRSPDVSTKPSAGRSE